MIGLLIHMGVVNLPRMEGHWSAGLFYDFQVVRICMPQDFFLIYNRCFRVADSVNDVEVVRSAKDDEVGIGKVARECKHARADRTHQIR